jgi:transcription antitermination factor NusG
MMLLDSKDIFWYVLFAANGKAAKISNYLETVNIECFFPKHYIEKKISNSQRTKLTLQPLLGNFVFVKSSQECLNPHLGKIKQKFGISSGLYYRDLSTREIIIVPEKQMQDFITIASFKGDQIIFLSNEEINLKKGTKVRIIGGLFEGIEGIFIRVKGDRRVVVTLPNLLSVATTFVPLEYILPLK